MMKAFMLIFVLGATLASPKQTAKELVPRQLDQYATGTMMEDGNMRAAAPECRGQMGWIYHAGFCYMFTSYHTAFLKAEEECNQVGGYLSDVLTKEENDWIKSVLAVINPKDGTDYWLGGLDADKDKGMQWITGAAMEFKDFVKDQPDGTPYAHMNFDLQFQWDSKDDANDKDNGFICKRPV